MVYDVYISIGTTIGSRHRHPSTTPFFLSSEAYSPNFQMRSEVPFRAEQQPRKASPLKSSFLTYTQLGGGNSNIFYFHPKPWGDDPIWRAYFSDGLVQPPTSQFKNLHFTDENHTINDFNQ